MLLQVGAYGDPGRDPRGWTVTVAYAAVVPSTEMGVKAAVSVYTAASPSGGSAARLVLGVTCAFMLLCRGGGPECDSKLHGHNCEAMSCKLLQTQQHTIVTACDAFAG